MAKPLRFRRSPQTWDKSRVHSQLLDSLQRNIGATAVAPNTEIGGDWETHRFDMDNGDVALFAHSDGEAYWMGNTETPEALWQTDKYGWTAVPYHVARWAQRELTDQLHREAEWLAAFPHLSWYFLPVFMSKDGRSSTRRFFREHAAGFPETDWRTGTQFFEEFLHTGVLDEYREVMAGKLGTSERLDPVRMSAAMGEFIGAKVLVDAGYRVQPEIEVTTGHSLDFRAERGETNVLVEITRPVSPDHRVATSPGRAIRETVSSKTDDQLARHGGGATLFVDCSSFTTDQWDRLLADRPSIDHRPAVVYRARPDDRTEGYPIGSVPLEVDNAIRIV